MAKTIIYIGIFLLSFYTSKAQIYKAKDGSTNINFFSASPLEDITAVNKGAIIIFNTTSSDIQIRVSVINFKFKNALMEEHFNENYMETEKYPNAIFKGKINEAVDFSKDGETKVTVTGKLDMHGVIKDVTYSGTVTKAGTEIGIKTKFKVKLIDHNIKVPSLYVKNIAEIIDVDVQSTLEPFQKK